MPGAAGAAARGAELIDAGERLEAKAYILEGRHYVRAEAEAVKSASARLGVGAPALRFKA